VKVVPLATHGGAGSGGLKVPSRGISDFQTSIADKDGLVATLARESGCGTAPKRRSDAEGFKNFLMQGICQSTPLDASTAARGSPSSPERDRHTVSGLMKGRLGHL
jgi:hypothetical protein